MFLRSLLLLLAVSPTSAQVRYSSSSYVRAVLAASPETAKVEEQFSAASARLKSDIAQTFLPSLSFSGTLSPAKLDRKSVV